MSAQWLRAVYWYLLKPSTGIFYEPAIVFLEYQQKHIHVCKTHMQGCSEQQRSGLWRISGSGKEGRANELRYIQYKTLPSSSMWPAVIQREKIGMFWAKQADLKSGFIGIRYDPFICTVKVENHSWWLRTVPACWKSATNPYNQASVCREGQCRRGI